MYASDNVIKKKQIHEYVICLYVRLSIEDDDVLNSSYKTESGSITTQRALLHDYIKHQKEFAGCRIVEKCDDGFLGTHFDSRPQFLEMIELAKKGKIDCIIVKDFSKFGRDYGTVRDKEGIRWWETDKKIKRGVGKSRKYP